jgi:hypothetical protein
MEDKLIEKRLFIAIGSIKYGSPKFPENNCQK